MKRFLKALMASLRGYGSCYRCGEGWDRVKGHSTNYCPNDQYHRELPAHTSETPRQYCRGCFPLCEACWQALGTPEARWPYYKRLLDDWAKCGCADNVTVSAAPIKNAVFEGR